MKHLTTYEAFKRHARHGPLPSIVGQSIGLLSLLALAAACGPARSYELQWTLGCDNSLGPCEVQTIRDCSSVGVDAVEVLALRDGSEWRTVFPCFSASEGAVGRGPDLSPNAYELEIYTLSAAGHRLIAEPVLANATVPEEGYQAVKADLTVRPQCSDGVDNDRDIRVDLFDPGCIDVDDLDESE